MYGCSGNGQSSNLNPSCMLLQVKSKMILSCIKIEPARKQKVFGGVSSLEKVLKRVTCC